MPEYPIDKPDSEGNTPLLLAYIKVYTFKIDIILKIQKETDSTSSYSL